MTTIDVRVWGEYSSYRRQLNSYQNGVDIFPYQHTYKNNNTLKFELYIVDWPGYNSMQFLPLLLSELKLRGMIITGYSMLNSGTTQYELTANPSQYITNLRLSLFDHFQLTC